MSKPPDCPGCDLPVHRGLNLKREVRCDSCAASRIERLEKLLEDVTLEAESYAVALRLVHSPESFNRILDMIEEMRGLYSQIENCTCLGGTNV